LAVRSKNNKNAGTAVALVFCLCINEPVSSEVVFDGSLGPPGALNGDMVITDSFGQQVGSNLFHSFLTFNVNLGETATFTSASLAPIDNVIGRVTGGSFSTIDGELGSTIPGASLWLINPNGVLFGENATLNVSGSFHATTADHLTLADGGQFGADLSIAENTMLTIADPASFGFVDSFVEPILVQESVLRVNNGESLSFVGGDIEISGGVPGSLIAPGGDINIASVASAGEAFIGPAGVDISAFSAHGTVALFDNGFMSVSELSGFNGAGSVFIRGGEVFIIQSQIFANTFTGDSGAIDIQSSGNTTVFNSNIASSTADVGRTADINIIAGGDLVITQGSQIRTLTDVGATANAGNILLAGTNVEVSDQSRVTSVTFGFGNAGNIIAAAVDNVSIINSTGTQDFTTGIASESAVFAAGDTGEVLVVADVLSMNAGLVSTDTVLSDGAGGNITIDVGELAMTNEALISSAIRGDVFLGGGTGAGGSITVNASRTIDMTGQFTSIQSTTSGSGDAGSIDIATPDLTLSGGAIIQSAPFGSLGGDGGSISIAVDRLLLSSSQIDSGPKDFSAASSSGQAGAISIIATESVLLENPFGDAASLPSISTTTFGTGNAGPITIVTPILTIDNGRIDTNSILNPFGSMSGAGDAGVVTIAVDNLSISNGGSISSDTSTDGNGGFVDIDVTDAIVITGLSDISTSSLGSGDAGSIEINTGFLLLEDDGAILAFTANKDGQGGSIDIVTNDMRLENNGSIISLSLNSTGNAGDISISTSNLEMFSGSDILTSSSQSAGGNVDIQATDLVYLVDSRIESAADGVTPTDSGGNVTINRPEFFVLNNSLISASANAGNGGNITIGTNAFVSSSDSIVTATSNTGVDGVITIESPNDVTGSIVDLTAEIFDADVILTDECTPRAFRERSTFTVDRGATPPRPDAFLSAIESITHETTGHIGHLTEVATEKLYAIRFDECSS
jgi:filamentous hemagglutinin family protein